MTPTLGSKEGVGFPRKKRYEGVRFNVISVARCVGGCQISMKKCYVILERPLTPEDTVVSGDMRRSAFLYSLQDWLLRTCHIIDDVPLPKLWL